MRKIHTLDRNHVKGNCLRVERERERERKRENSVTIFKIIIKIFFPFSFVAPLVWFADVIGERKRSERRERERQRRERERERACKITIVRTAPCDAKAHAQ